MDIKEYISSGIIEKYVLGSVSPQERQEVECMSSIYPEIREELRSLQTGIENFAIRSAVSPPEALKSRVMAAIEDVEQPGAEGKASAPTVTRDVSKSTSKTIQLWQRWAAVGLILVLALAGLMYYQNTEWQDEFADMKQQIEEREDAVANLEDRMATLNESQEELLAINQTLADTATREIKMSGTDLYPQGLARVFWNREKASVLMDYGNMPAPPEGQVYQLWAIVDGTPTDMGVFPWKDDRELPVRMPEEVRSADAFAVTLEPEGGSEEPTLSNLFVIGNT